jgi:alpha-L-arabinofuranosidase
MTGTGVLAQVNGPDVGATNSFAEPDRVGVKERTVDLQGDRVELDFPAHSVTVVRASLLARHRA